MYANVRVFPDDGELFAKIDAIFQVRDTCLSCSNDIERCRGLQPLRETLFPHAGADSAEELKQASSPEQIEISSVNVVRIVELRALLAGPGPAVFHAGQTLAAE